MKLWSIVMNNVEWMIFVIIIWNVLFIKNNFKRYQYSELLLVRMIVRIITHLSIDGGKPDVDWCPDVPQNIPRRRWCDLLGHRDEIGYSERHFKEWLLTKQQLEYIYLEIVWRNWCLWWTIYLTTSRFNHSCQPDITSMFIWYKYTFKIFR